MPLALEVDSDLWSKLRSSSLDVFWRFTRGDLSANEFKGWLYRNENLEHEIGWNIYLELISVDFLDPREISELKRLFAKSLPRIASCLCHQLPDKACIGMFEWQECWCIVDNSVRDLFWLRQILCDSCQTNWLIAADTIIYDVLLLSRGLPKAWPEVETYRGLLSEAKAGGSDVRYIDPMTSIELPVAIKTLFEENPAISLSELVEILPVSGDVIKKHTRAVFNHLNKGTDLFSL
jgi:hypothetical protein